MVSAETTTSNPALQTHPTKVLDMWRELGLADDVLAAALDVDTRALGRWSRGMYPQLAARRRLASLEQLQAHLRETFVDGDAIRLWLHADNRYLGGLKPAEALRAGRIDRVEAAVTALDSGNFV